MIANITDRHYTSWNFDPAIPDISFVNPFSQKIFHQDQIEYQEKNNKITIIQSTIRTAKYIPGVLILEKNLTYGRTTNKKRLLYSCIPFQKELPVFLVPYEIQLGFQKTILNKYVLFRFDNWQDKHPHGILVETIGDVDHLPAHYEYLLYCKNVRKPACPKPIRQLLLENPPEYYVDRIFENPEKYGYIADQRVSETRIFSIDPKGCVDRDDALSILKTESPNRFTVSVYIANVWVWIETFQLWDYLEICNISTIYLPDKNRTMLPDILSETICSLDVGKTCFSVVMEFDVDLDTNTILKKYVYQSAICISKNFDYDSAPLLKYPDYKLLLQVTQRLDSNIKDSHELVAFWMMKMNTCMAEEMYKKQKGIFRTAKSANPEQPIIQHKNPELELFLQLWENRISGEYITYSPDQLDYAHCIMNVEKYMHFTSPIRRIVDLWNQIIWVGKHPAKINETVMEKINRENKTIRKIQNECELLHKFQNISDTELQTGVIIDMEPKSKTNQMKYSVYLPKYKCIIWLIENPGLNLYSEINCRILYFKREDKYQHKIRLSLEKKYN
jgi:exoribonuclease R